MKIPRSNGDDDLAPSWISVVNPDGTPARPVIRCKCGQWCGVGKHHIHPDGRMTASFWHSLPMTNNPCGFHETLELDGYDGPEFKPE